MTPVSQRRQRRTHSPAGIDHVIDQHYRPPLKLERDITPDQAGIARGPASAVTIRGNIEVAHSDTGPALLAEQSSKALRQTGPAPNDANQSEAFGSAVMLGDFMRHTPHAACDRFAI